MRLSRPTFVPFALGAVVLAALSACGGGGGDSSPAPVVPTPPPVAPSAISGSVAIGAPITQGVLRVLDADGNVVAHDIAIADDGTYADVALTGNGPWRLEACGYAGANWRCMYSVAQAAGTANVTPLTSAQVALASGHEPGSMMDDGGQAPAADALTSAQDRLRGGLASTLSDAGLPADVDFTTATLAAGSRTGYDRVLDAVSVTTGTDDGAFVQVTPRLGDGNLYITPTATQGTITTQTAASDLPLGGLTTLFEHMSAAMASASACADPQAGITASLAIDAQMSMGGGGPMVGRAQVGAGLCQFFGSGDDGSTPMWGASLISPTLGRCDFSGADPKCAVSFVLKDPQGDVQAVGGDMAVIYHESRWWFYGDVNAMSINANAAVQRVVRVDDPTTPVRYGRALQFDIAVTPGVACAQVSQHGVDGSPVTVAYFKVHEPSASRMSLWTTDGNGNGASTDPLNGAMRTNDDTWVGVPEGTAGDEVVRNFYRGGRSVTVSVFSDAACATPAVVGGKSAFEVDVKGVPPVSTALGTLSWGSLTDGAKTALMSFTLGDGQAGSFDTAWTFADGGTAFDEATFCVAGSCGDGSISRLGQKSIRPSDRAATIALRGPFGALGAGDYKELVLGGRDGSGMNVESEFVSCSAHAAGTDCWSN
jgi:hypothetical protein